MFLCCSRTSGKTAIPLWMTWSSCLSSTSKVLYYRQTSDWETVRAKMFNIKKPLAFQQLTFWYTVVNTHPCKSKKNYILYPQLQKLTSIVSYLVFNHFIRLRFVHFRKNWCLGFPCWAQTSKEILLIFWGKKWSFKLPQIFCFLVKREGLKSQVRPVKKEHSRGHAPTIHWVPEGHAGLHHCAYWIH